MEKINVVHYMNEFRNILSYATNIGFFFGAGTSCAFGLPNIISLTEDTAKKLDVDDKVTFDKVRETISNLSGITDKTSISVESILNYIRQVREITQGRKDYNVGNVSGEQAKKLDTAICNAIFNIISTKEKTADISPIRQFMAWYDSANRDFIKEIYTTNYDMLLEMAMEANYIPYFDGFVGGYEPFFSPESIEGFPNEGDLTNKWVRLWKIHGSLNWMKKEATSTSAERIVRSGKIDVPYNELMIYPSKEKYNLSRKEPYIAYFDRFKSYLQHGELVLICSGYSFSDQHINDLIFNALRQNKRLYVMVFCYADEQVETMNPYANSHMNLCIMGPKKMILNGIEREWLFDTTDDEDLCSGLYWNKTKQTFELGDFRRLIGFLIENSGRKSMVEEIANAK